MATVIHGKAGGDSVLDQLPSVLLEVLPYKLTEELRRGRNGGRIEELRLRSGRRASLTVEGENVFLNTVLSRAEMDETVSKLCEGSLYAHRDSIAVGYVTLAGGIRVGICGRAAIEGERIVGVYDVTGLNVRIPSRIRGLGKPICQLLRERKDGKGVLIYAPPGEGKTTLLRCVAAQMASGDFPLRVAVIDTRGELGVLPEDRELCLDLLTGYPRGLGIEIATRTMNAQLIVCDEIGETREAEAILAAQNSGVPFLASAHADCVEGLLERTGIRRLHEARVFGAYAGILRRRGGGEFLYTITDWEEANDRIQNTRCRYDRS
ncbi:MAG: hypothetical protein IJX94_03190 [Clostridia bacterium]|nr:hypothetical protein [Clostridia bacterium]